MEGEVEIISVNLLGMIQAASHVIPSMVTKGGYAVLFGSAFSEES